MPFGVCGVLIGHRFAFIVNALPEAHPVMKILIADDHRLIVEAVADKLAELGPQVRFVQALSVEELMASLIDDLDLAIIDLGMPGAQGIDHIQEVRRRKPALPVIVLSGHDDPAIMREALQAGAMGFIPKAYSPDVMLLAVRLVLAGGIYVPPLMLSEVASLDPLHQAASISAARAEGQQHSGGANAGPETSLAQLRNVLTERQLDVLILLSQGKPNKLIGRSLGISEGTVKIHLAAIFRALKVRNRTEAVIAARALEERV